jgi:hypothetical protein
MLHEPGRKQHRRVDRKNICSSLERCHLLWHRMPGLERGQSCMKPHAPKVAADVRGHTSSPFSRRQLVPPFMWDQIGRRDLAVSPPRQAEATRAGFGGGGHGPSFGGPRHQMASQRPQSGQPAGIALTSTWETRVGSASAPTRPGTAKARLERTLNCSPLSDSRSGTPAHRAQRLYTRVLKSAGSSRSMGQTLVPSPPPKIIRPSTAGAVTDRSLADLLGARSAREHCGFDAPRNMTGA